MLFNSPGFLFLFLPVLLLVFYPLGRRNPRWAAAWLTLGSLFFYAWWNPVYVLVLLASILFNYGVGRRLVRLGERAPARRRYWLLLGLAGNLALLGYFKYANFFLATVQSVAGHTYTLSNTVLPLGISFFTFTQIAYLVDAASGRAREPDLLHYTLFVSYFPHLIAGPVLHHAEMMPQFAHATTWRFNPAFMAVGLTLFALGLFKKAVLADGIAPFVGPVFAAAEQGVPVGLFEAWGGALAYSLQLYFDFSGYSDMAIGLSSLIGVRLPLNFNSPYQATSISDFWRRWHMTLSRFLRDYVYIPLGGNKRGAPRRYANLLATMLLGGLWHGAGWTFVLWGGLHGLALALHQAWRGLRARLGHDMARTTALGRGCGMALTFLLGVVGWVFFRASSVASALSLVKAMAGLQGVQLPSGIGLRLGSLGVWLEGQGMVFTPASGHALVMNFVWAAALLPLVFFAPNTQQIMRRFQPALHYGGNMHPAPLAWQPTTRSALALSVVLALGLLSLSRPAEFLYFQF